MLNWFAEIQVTDSPKYQYYTCKECRLKVNNSSYRSKYLAVA